MGKMSCQLNRIEERGEWLAGLEVPVFIHNKRPLRRPPFSCSRRAWLPCGVWLYLHRAEGASAPWCGHVGNLAVRELAAGSFQCILKGTFFFFLYHIHISLAKTDVKSYFLNECVKSSHSCSKSAFLENSHESLGTVPWDSYNLLCGLGQVTCGVYFLSCTVRGRPGWFLIFLLD